MTKIFDYIKENATGVTILSVTFAACFGLALAAGCSLSDIVKVNVPPTVQEVTNTKSQVTLTQAPYVRERYINNVTTAIAEFDANIEQASAFRDFAASLLNTGFSAGEGALAGVPGGALLVGALGALGGLFLKKPGTDAAIQAEKEASFHAGQRKAQALLAGAYTPSAPITGSNG